MSSKVNLTAELKELAENSHEVFVTVEDILIEDPVERIMQILNGGDEELVDISKSLVLFLAVAPEEMWDKYVHDNSSDPVWRREIHVRLSVLEELKERFPDLPLTSKFGDVLTEEELTPIIQKHMAVADLLYPDTSPLTLKEIIQQHLEGWLSDRSVVSLDDFMQSPRPNQWDERMRDDPSWTEEVRGKKLIECFMKALNACGFREWHPFDPEHPRWKRDLA